MSAVKRAKEKERSRFVALYHWVMNTEAWRDLDTVARCVYIELASRYAGPGSNNGSIPYSLLELADALHISKQTAMRALDKLQDHGFIVLTKRGAFSVKNRQSTEWRLTEFKCDTTGQLPTKEFSRWKNQNTVPPRNPNGFPHGTERVSRRNRLPIITGPTVPPRNPLRQTTVPPRNHY